MNAYLHLHMYIIQELAVVLQELAPEVDAIILTPKQVS
jgi:hypothetical protein